MIGKLGGFLAEGLNQVAQATTNAVKARAAKTTNAVKARAAKAEARAEAKAEQEVEVKAIHFSPNGKYFLLKAEGTKADKQSLLYWVQVQGQNNQKSYVVNASDKFEWISDTEWVHIKYHDSGGFSSALIYNIKHKTPKTLITPLNPKQVQITHSWFVVLDTDKHIHTRLWRSTVPNPAEKRTSLTGDMIACYNDNIATFSQGTNTIDVSVLQQDTEHNIHKMLVRSEPHMMKWISEDEIALKYKDYWVVHNILTGSAHRVENKLEGKPLVSIDSIPALGYYTIYGLYYDERLPILQDVDKDRAIFPNDTTPLVHRNDAVGVCDSVLYTCRIDGNLMVSDIQRYPIHQKPAPPSSSLSLSLSLPLHEGGGHDVLQYSNIRVTPNGILQYDDQVQIHDECRAVFHHSSGLDVLPDAFECEILNSTNTTIYVGFVASDILNHQPLRIDLLKNDSCFFSSCPEKPGSKIVFSCTPTEIHFWTRSELKRIKHPFHKVSDMNPFLVMKKTNTQHKTVGEVKVTQVFEPECTSTFNYVHVPPDTLELHNAHFERRTGLYYSTYSYDDTKKSLVILPTNKKEKTYQVTAVRALENKSSFSAGVDEYVANEPCSHVTEISITPLSIQWIMDPPVLFTNLKALFIHQSSLIPSTNNVTSSATIDKLDPHGTYVWDMCLVPLDTKPLADNKPRLGSLVVQDEKTKVWLHKIETTGSARVPVKMCVHNGTCYVQASAGTHTFPDTPPDSSTTKLLLTLDNVRLVVNTTLCGQRGGEKRVVRKFTSHEKLTIQLNSDAKIYIRERKDS